MFYSTLYRATFKKDKKEKKRHVYNSLFFSQYPFKLIGVFMNGV